MAGICREGTGHWGGTLLERSESSLLPRSDPLPWNKCELLLLLTADELNLFSEQKAELLDGCRTNWALGFGGQYNETPSWPFLKINKRNLLAPHPHRWKFHRVILDRMFDDFERFDFLATVGRLAAQETTSWRCSKRQSLKILWR